MDNDENQRAPAPTTDSSASTTDVGLTAKKMDELLARARQTVKPIIAREAANEVVTDDVLNFRMKIST
jgi:hypothetical protein